MAGLLSVDRDYVSQLANLDSKVAVAVAVAAEVAVTDKKGEEQQREEQEEDDAIEAPTAAKPTFGWTKKTKVLQGMSSSLPKGVQKKTITELESEVKADETRLLKELVPARRSDAVVGELLFERERTTPWATKGATICAVGIVRKEWEIMDRMLKSLAPFCSHIVLTFTGFYANTKLEPGTKPDKDLDIDTTVESIQLAMAKYDLGGRIYWAPFRDFGYTRTVALQLACVANCADYLLLTDADYIWKYKDLDWLQTLDADSYQVQTEEDLMYWRPHLVKPTLAGICYTGRTHEALHVPLKNQKQIFSLTLQHKGDGGCKDDKLQRDERLLLMDLADKPGDARSYFYLAQTYEGLGRHKDAIKYARLRIRAKDWEEEVYYSYFIISRVRKSMASDKPTPMFVAACLEAFMCRPHRLEGMAQCIGVLRNKHHKTALAIGSLALFNDFPSQDKLFINVPDHRWKYPFEMSICAHYCQEYVVLSHWLNRKLLKMRDDRPWDAAQTETNFGYHKTILCSEASRFLTDFKDEVGVGEKQGLKDLLRKTPPQTITKMLSAIETAHKAVNNSQFDEAIGILKECISQHPVGWFASRMSMVEDSEMEKWLETLLLVDPLSYYTLGAQKELDDRTRLFYYLKDNALEPYVYTLLKSYRWIAQMMLAECKHARAFALNKAEEVDVFEYLGDYIDACKMAHSAARGTATLAPNLLMASPKHMLETSLSRLSFVCSELGTSFHTEGGQHLYSVLVRFLNSQVGPNKPFITNPAELIAGAKAVDQMVKACAAPAPTKEQLIAKVHKKQRQQQPLLK